MGNPEVRGTATKKNEKEEKKMVSHSRLHHSML